MSQYLLSVYYVEGQEEPSGEVLERMYAQVDVFNQKMQGFEFRPGPVFVNVLLADEINRATPRTQSALLEAMQ